MTTTVVPRGSRTGSSIQYLLLAAVAYVPLLLARPGDVNADTKLYLYLDPAGLLGRALSLWDPAVGGGTVTHQTIGYLWPMGPYFWLTDMLGMPDWVAQRLWLGTIVFVAAAGTLHLLNHLLPRRAVNIVGALAYGVTPYLLGHATGQSALLLPFAALPWMVVFMDRACREGGWRWPAAYALAVATCGSLNGSSVFFVVVGSALWPPILSRAVAGVSLGSAVRAVARCGALTLLMQLWWLVGYAVGGRYGLPLLATTETIQTTSATTASTEVFRGLGYWFFYGADTTAAWLDNLAPVYMRNVALITVGFVVPVAALLAGGLIRWTHRAYFATLTVIGLVLAVGAYGAGGRSPFGAALLRTSESSDLILSLRNTQRATPLLLLGLAGLLTAGLHALVQRRPNVGHVAAGFVVVAVAASFPAYWGSGLIAERFHRSEEPPAHWTDAAAHLDQGEGRILEIPGIDFAAYRWGNTLDPVTPGLVDRPVLARELVPMGSPPGVNLLAALDRSIHEGYFEERALAPVARLLGASDVLVRSDLEFERYRTVRPPLLWASLLDTPRGLGPPVTFGDGFVNRTSDDQPMLDEMALGIDPAAAHPPAVAVFPVLDPSPLVRAEATSGGTIIAGDGEGVVAAAAAGLFENPGTVRYAADVTRSPGALARALAPDTRLVITDSNRLRGHRWYSMRENTGATEVPGQPALDDDPGDARVPPVSDQLDRSSTVAEHRGAVRLWASAYGNPVTMTPESRAVMAFDGDPRTAWTVETGRFDGPTIIGIELETPVDPGHIVLRQPMGQPGTRAVEVIEIRRDRGPAATIELDGRSFSPDGQSVPLDGPFRVLEIELVRTAPGAGPAGFGTVDIPGVVVEEIIHLPTDLFDVLGDQLLDHPLAIVLSRHRIDPAEVVRRDPEIALSRAVTLPRDVGMELTGTARLSAAARDSLIDRLVGIAPADEGGLTATSREHLSGQLGHRASSAFDGRLDTAWRTPFGDQRGNWIEVSTADPFELDAIVLDLLTDGRHSVPRTIQVEVDDESPVLIDVPPLEDLTEPGATTRIRLPLAAPLGGTTMRITAVEIAERTTRDWFTGDPIALPFGVAGIDLAGTIRPEPAAALDDRCHTSLLSVNGRPVGIRFTGDTATALARGPIEVSTCEPGVELVGGENVLRTVPGASTGFDLDRVVLQSGSQAVATPVQVPDIDWTRSGSTAIDVDIAPMSDEPFWLLMSESWSEGWQATTGGTDLGPPELHDAFGMGWLVEPTGGETMQVQIRWTPQGTVNMALIVSALGALACGFLILRPRRHPAPVWRAAEPVFAGQGIRTATMVPVGATFVAGALLIGPFYGAVLAGLVGVSARLPRFRVIIGLVPAALLAVAGTYVALQQWRWGYLAEFTWPENFARVHHLALAAPLLLAALTWTDLMAAPRRARPSPDPTGDAQPLAALAGSGPGAESGIS